MPQPERDSSAANAQYRSDKATSRAPVLISPTNYDSRTQKLASAVASCRDETNSGDTKAQELLQPAPSHNNVACAEVRDGHPASQQRLRAPVKVSAAHGRYSSPHREAARPPLVTRSNLHAGQQGAASTSLPTSTSWYNKRTQACVEDPTDARRQAQRNSA